MQMYKYKHTCKMCVKTFQSDNNRDRICPRCQKKIDRTKNTELFEYVRKIDEYNEEHNTKLSYGDYSVKFGLI